MDAHEARIEAARRRNLAYIRQLDEQQAQREADAFLQQFTGGSGSASASVDCHADADDGGSAADRRKRPSGHTAPKNTSVYITGLTTYMACKQLEGVCGQIGKVRRIKFYKDERGGLKGDALVTFASNAMMQRAIERLDHFEIKPGVLITATAASFGVAKTRSSSSDPAPRECDKETPCADLPERLFDANLVTAVDSEDARTVNVDQVDSTNGSTENTAPSVTTMATSDLPSRSIILRHAWDPVAPQDDATKFFSELEDDMRIECGKHGEIDHVHILPSGGVMVRFKALEAAIKCLPAMNGRWFDGRQLQAVFDPSTPEEPKDDDSKLEAFLASLG